MAKWLRNEYDKKLTYENLMKAHINSKKGKTLRKDKAAYSDFMEYCKTSKKFPRNTYVCIADDINDIFDNMGDYYEQKINKENHEDGEPIITLGTLLDDYTNEIHETR